MIIGRALFFTTGLLILFISQVVAAAPETMRLDFYHTGNIDQELLSIDRVVIEPLPWPGHPDKNIDNTNLGKYLFEVYDKGSNRLLFSRGFNSIYGEWETTDEAKKLTRTFHESLRFPSPASVVQIVVKKRAANNNFKEIWRIDVDPRDIFIDRARPAAPAPLIEILKNGDAANKVDILILGDGYTAAEQQKFIKDAQKMVNFLFLFSPFKERKEDFNIWGLCPPTAESGVSRPSSGIYRHTPLGLSYDAFGIERYMLTFENRAFRTIASHAPYEFVEILANNRTYGGGGIYGLYSTVAVDNALAPFVFVHEFGHHLAGLADEYYSSPVAYAPATERVEPWEPNVTALLDAKNVKWKDLVSADTPLPTPWNKDEHDNYMRGAQKQRAQIRAEGKEEEAMERLFGEMRNERNRLFGREKYFNRVGAFEGAMYESKGYYRPQLNCIMFTTQTDYFCAVCKRALVQVIDLYTGK